MEKKIIEYLIPIQGKKDCEKHNEMCKEMFGESYTPIKPTEDHIEFLIERLYDTINEVGADGGWYVSDGIRVKIEIEYEPENK